MYVLPEAQDSQYLPDQLSVRNVQESYRTYMHVLLYWANLILAQYSVS